MRKRPACFTGTSALCLFAAVLLAFFLATKPVQGAEFTVIPSASIGTQYNDNINFTEKDKEEDAYAVLAAELQLRQRVERGSINVKGKIYSYSYAEIDEYNSIDQEISAEGTYALSPLVTANASGLYKIDYQQDRDITSTGLVSTNSKREQSQESFGLDWAFSEKTSLGAQVTFGETVYEDEDYSDRTMQSYSLELKRNLSKIVSETTGLIYLSHSRYDYDLSQSRYTSASFGFGKNLNEKYSVFLWAGPSFVETDYKENFNESSNEWGATAHFSLEGKFEKSIMNLSLTHKLEPDSFNTTSAYRTTLSGSYMKRLSSDLRLGLAVSYFHNESSGKENALANTIDEDTFNISPRVLYQITDDLGLEANYRFSRIEDNETGGSRMQNSFFLQFNWSHSISESDFAYLL